MPRPQFLPSRSSPYRGSWLLRSALTRLAVALLVSLALWLLTATALGWWSL